MICLGDLVRHKITGFEGVVIAEAKWLTGCRRFAVQSRSLHEGKPQGSEWFDEDQVEFVEHTEMTIKGESPHTAATSQVSPPRGGPMSPPQQQPNPS